METDGGRGGSGNEITLSNLVAGNTTVNKRQSGSVCESVKDEDSDVIINPS